MRKLLAFAAVYLIWGSTYLAIGVGVRDIPPFLMAGVRFFIAGTILFLFARRGEAPLTRREWAEAALAGVLFFRHAAEICLLLAMTGVGLQTSFAGLRRIGLRPFLFGLFAAAVVGGVSLLLISGFGSPALAFVGA